MTTLDVDVKPVLGAPSVQGKVVQSDSDSLWYKQDGSGTWEPHSVQPSGTLVTGAFLALISINTTTYYRPFYDGIGLMDSAGNIPEIYFPSLTAPGKCRRPIKP